MQWSRLDMENKYLPERVPQDDLWDRRTLVYQFFFSADRDHSEQLKIIFNFSTLKMSGYRVRKTILSEDTSRKESDYVDAASVDTSTLLGIPHVLKIRSIKDPLFMDRYLRAEKQIYMLEIEDEPLMSEHRLFGKLRCVSGQKEYMNENLAVCFNENDRMWLNSMISLFKSKQSIEM